MKHAWFLQPNVSTQTQTQPGSAHIEKNAADSQVFGFQTHELI
jgi:hypothetical protein